MKKLFASTPLHQIFFYLTIFCIPIQLGYHFWPSWTLVLGRRVDYLSPTLYFLDLLIIATLFMWNSFQIQKYSRWILAFLFIFGSNIFFAQNKFVSMYAWVKFLEFFLFGFYIVKTKPPIIIVSSVLSISAGLISLVALGQTIFQHSLGGIFWFLGERTFSLDTAGIARIDFCGFSLSCTPLLRAYATFPHPNVFGGFLAVAIPMQITSLLYQKKQKRFKWILVVSLIVSCIALILTFSRTTLFVTILSSIFLVSVLLRNARALSRKIFIAFCFVLFFIGVNTFISLPKEFSETESVVVRNQLSAASIEMIRNNPLIGVGLGNFLVTLPHYLTSRQIYFLQPVHMIYLSIMSELGVIVASGVLFILFRLAYISAKTIIVTRKITNVRLALQTSNPSILFLILFFIGFFDHYLITLEQGQLIFTLVIGLLLSSTSIKNTSTT